METGNRKETDLMIFGPNGFRAVMDLDHEGETINEMEQKAKRYQYYMLDMQNIQRKAGKHA